MNFNLVPFQSSKSQRSNHLEMIVNAEEEPGSSGRSSVESQLETAPTPSKSIDLHDACEDGKKLIVNPVCIIEFGNVIALNGIC